MKPRRVLLFAVGTVLGVVALISSLPKASQPCPAVGYAYTGDLELTFSSTPESVAACLGDECVPQPVARNAEGKWLVPQSPPHLNPPVSVTSIHVDAIGTSGARIDRALPIETESTGEHPFGRECGGPFRFKPVQVTLD